MFEWYYPMATSVLAPLLSLPLIVMEVLMAVILTFVMALFYKFFVNQTKVKELKTKQKELRDKQNELMKTNPDEAKKLTSEILKLSGQQSRMNMRSMIPTTLLIILILPWIAHVSMPSIPITPLDDTNTTFTAVFTDNIFGSVEEKNVSILIKNVTKEGEIECGYLIFCGQKYTYTYDIDYNNDGVYDEKDLEIGDPVKVNNDWLIGKVNGQTGEMSLGAVAAKLPFTPPVFYYGLGWLMWYFIVSFPLSFLFRKLLGVEL